MNSVSTGGVEMCSMGGGGSGVALGASRSCACALVEKASATASSASAAIDSFRGARTSVRRLARELSIDQASIRTVTLHQLVVRAALHDLAAVEHDHAIGIAHRREAMRDHQGGAPTHQAIE